MSRLTRGAMAIAFALTCSMAQISTQSEALAAQFDLGLTGRVSMQGAILSSACDIATVDRYQTVNMPDAARGTLKRVGTGDPRHFYIHLTNCTYDTTADDIPLPYMQIIFDGDEEQGMFRLAGNVSGIALELLDRYGDVIHPGEAISNRELIVDDNRLDFQLRLHTTMKALMVGDYHALIRYRIEYF